MAMRDRKLIKWALIVAAVAFLLVAIVAPAVVNR
jgi:hypothetical protein